MQRHQIDHLEARRRKIVARLRQRIIASGIPRTRLAVAAGLSEMTLRRFDASTWNPSAETMRKLDAYLSAAQNRTTIRNIPSECKGSAPDGPEEAAA